MVPQDQRSEGPRAVDMLLCTSTRRAVCGFPLPRIEQFSDVLYKIRRLTEEGSDQPRLPRPRRLLHESESTALWFIFCALIRGHDHSPGASIPAFSGFGSTLLFVFATAVLHGWEG